MADDGEILRSFVENGSEAAFRELVQRHLGIVYAAALRQTRDRHTAEDVAQVVFASLARNAPRLCDRSVIVGWLYTTTHYAAAKAIRTEMRRRAREQQAYEMNAEREPNWENLRPVLDEAMHDLEESERESVLMRFFQGLSFAEMAAPLRISEDGARKRVDRAVDRLRASLVRRGVTSTPAALAAALASQPAAAAPGALVGAITASAVAGGGAVGGTAVAAALVTLMKAKVVIPIALVALLAFFTGSYTARSRTLPAEPPARATRDADLVTSLRRENGQLAAKADALNAELSRLAQKNTDLAGEIAAIPRPPAPKNLTLGVADWEIQQTVLNNLRQIDAARADFARKKGRNATSILEFVGDSSPEPYIKAIRSANGEDYASLSTDPSEMLTVTMANGTPITFDPAGARTTNVEVPEKVLLSQAQAQARQQRVNELNERLFVGPNSAMNRALAEYRQRNPGAPVPASPEALMPYFGSDQERADLTEFVQMQSQGKK